MAIEPTLEVYRDVSSGGVFKVDASSVGKQSLSQQIAKNRNQLHQRQPEVEDVNNGNLELIRDRLLWVMAHVGTLTTHMYTLLP